MEDNIVVYTCVAGKYDNIMDVAQRESMVSHVIFGDRGFAGCFTGWERRKIVSPPRLTNPHDINRYHKIFPHHVLEGVRYSVYLDGNIRRYPEIHTLVGYVTSAKAAIGVFRHPNRRTVREEAQACRDNLKFDSFDKRRVGAQLAFYESEGFNLETPVSANYLIVRDHAYPGLPLTMSLWWSQLFEYTKRDQMSLNYVLWKTGTPWVFLDDAPGIDSTDLVRVGHKRSIARRIKGRVRPLLSRSGTVP